MNQIKRIARVVGGYFWTSNLRVEAAMVDAAHAAHAKSIEVAETANARLSDELQKLEASLLRSAQPSATHQSQRVRR